MPLSKIPLSGEVRRCQDGQPPSTDERAFSLHLSRSGSELSEGGRMAITTSASIPAGERPVFTFAPLPHLDQARELVAAIQQLSLARSLSDIQDIVRTAARRLTGADGATFVIREGLHCHYADEDTISPLWKGQRFPLHTCISGWAMLNRRAVAIEDIYDDP